MKTILLFFVAFNLSAQDGSKLHFLANSHGVPIIGITAFNMGYSQGESLLMAGSVMTAVSFGKEIIDKQRGRKFSWNDIAYDGRGIITGLFITLAVNGITQHIRDNREAQRNYRFYNPIQ